ncbi:granzyme B-like [Octodon degus]|uniref:Granzyme B-like n=1 Tax=Octodon degus TaxID=10160 RepID=A0A6P6DXG0_OCTDE|nr:granzyme B-like [Octodon degus]
MQLLLLLLAFFLPPKTRAGEIIGGHEAKPHSHPYMAYIKFWYTTFALECGGFLIDEKFVLTAAHCFHRSSESKHRKTVVLLGAHNIKKQEKSWQPINVKKHIPHPHFSTPEFNNDIMLLQLEEKAKLTKEVQIIELPKAKSQVNPGAVCQLAGWGSLVNDMPTDTLQEVEMTVKKDEECDTFFHYYDAATEICLGDPKIQKFPSKGDSGGPVICDNVVQAIISSGDYTTPPCVFIKLSPYLDWIKKTMEHH